jgi:formylglycine-generating enzyme required for sulfatase activity
MPLPSPFAWIDIPAGKVTVKNQTHDVPAFAIAKYPLTNTQFAPFIEAGGYRERKWWTDAGWGQRERDGWTEPRFWNDSKWNGTEQPVVGVSWYEAIAYCQWLSEQTGQKILLPTGQQWQRAAQGDDGRDYPWGSQWNRNLCNNNVDKKGIGKTTPVTQYEGNGDSPFGVVDMAGNVWEWCLTEYKSGNNSANGTEVRVLRGGSWFIPDTVIFRCDYRNRNDPYNRYSNWGFRLALSH